MGNTEIREKADSGRRNFALDLLRILSMLMIVSLHSGSHGGLNAFADFSSVSGLIIRVINIVCTVSVNVFVLISAYFLSAQRFRLSRILGLLLEVAFYSLLILGFLLVGRYPVGLTDLLYLVFPVSYGTWWFITSYLGMYLLSPLLNKLLSALNKQQHFFLMLILLILACVLRDVIVLSDPLLLNKGYSVAWFVIVYIFAYYIRHHLRIATVKKPLLKFFAICLSMVGIYAAMKALEPHVPFVSEHNLALFWSRYSSSLCLLGSIMLFICFLKVEINNRLSCKIISIVSPLTFGVYLLHDNPYMRDVIWIELLHMDRLADDGTLLLNWALSVVGVFAACLIIDWGRAQLFKLFNQRAWYRRTLKTIDDLPYSIPDRLGKALNK